MKCKNCNKPITDDYKYCPHCGQKSDIERLNFQHLLRDLWMAFSNTDRGMLLLVRQLVYRPGKVARGYISGQRKTYYNPFSFLAIMVAIAFFFILKFEDTTINYSSIETNEMEFLRFTFRYFNVFILFTCPIYGSLIWLFFIGRGANFVENLALSAYLSGQTMLYYIIIIIIFILFPSSMTILGLIFGLLISYWFIVAVLQFYQTRSAWSIIKSVLVILITQFVSQGILMFTFSIYKKYNLL
ncbi:DUF3667 domain-containing protein [Robiginitalea sp. IMCC44478]|uniref:DUF3667 domain-containing protein n=1 Tax=Robiginitalea sp. IMCC44478 TaxID=3459122 RepID=UPI0040424983